VHEHALELGANVREVIVLAGVGPRSSCARAGYGALDNEFVTELAGTVKVAPHTLHLDEVGLCFLGSNDRLLELGAGRYLVGTPGGDRTLLRTPLARRRRAC